MVRKMHLGAVLMNGPTHTVIGEWRGADYLDGYDYAQPEFWQETARLLEQGKFDMAFFADNLGASDDPPDEVIRYSVQWPLHDPAPLLPFMAAATTRLGLVATYSTSYSHPYETARRFATLAHLTRGRVGWNVVTSSYPADAANFGLDRIEGHAERYDRGDEFVDVCQKLWTSWEPGAVVGDRETGVWADPAKVHAINHAGKYYRCRGPLNVAPSPGGPPVITAAGQSDRGVDFCGRNAELAFGIQWAPEAMRPHRDRLRERAVANGRDPDSVKMLWGLKIFLGETEEVAQARAQAMLDLVPTRGALAMLKISTGFDASQVPLDAPLEAVGSQVFSQGLLNAVTKNMGRSVTVGEAAKLTACGLAPHVIGTPEQVATRLEELYDEAGGDGFLLMVDYSTTSIREFVETVVPILQARGRFRRDYAGTTLRSHIQET